MRTWKMLITAEKHCGHELGLTHPDFDAIPHDTDSPKYGLYRTRRKMWDWYVKCIQEKSPFDILIELGDNIDGKGDASAGTELILPKLSEQTDCASACIEEIGAREIYMVYGTPYHVGKDNCEDIIAKNVKAVKIGDHDYLKVGQTVFDYAHYVGGGQLPSAQVAQIAKERLINLLWAEHDEYPKADVVLRGHQHLGVYAGEMGSWLSMTVPGLQLSSKFGRHRVKTKIKFGMVYFEVRDDGTYDWEPLVNVKLRSARQELWIAK